MSAADWLVSSIQLASLIAVGLGVIVTSRRATEAQDSAVIIELGREFRKKWELGAGEAVRLLEHGRTLGVPEDVDPDLRDQLDSLLNWIDWLGVMIRHRVLRQPRVIIETIGPSMNRVIDLEWARVIADLEEHGEEHWAGVVEVARMLTAGRVRDRTR